jgi:arylsulfatase A-like enzyme
MDNILETILPDASRRDPLDRTVWGKDLRLCRTLDEMTARLAARGPTDAPVFAYSLPQDLHVAAIARERGEPVDEGAYDGFYAPVASRVRRLDGCLGTFVAQLKARGLYDRSVIILTSDHGDSLGEDGRMGHAYSLHPEIVRVPLIVHVPPAMRRAWHWDEGRAAFTTDLTPTLHQLLGHEPAAPAPFFGESLARRPGARTPRSRDRMVAASYGAVYGALLDDGTRYYVLDAVAMREMAFALGGGPEPGAPLPVTADLRYRGLDVIRDTVEGIGRFYGFTPPGLLPDAASAAPDPSGSHDGPPSP